MDKIRENLKPLVRYLRPHKKMIGTAYFFILISSLIQLFSPVLYGRVIDDTLEQKSFSLSILALLLVWLLIKIIGDWINRLNVIRMNKVAYGASTDMLINMVSHLILLPLSFHKEKKVGEIIQRFTRAEDSFYRIIEDGMFKILPNIITVIFAFGIILSIKLELALVYLLFVLAFILATALKTKPLIRNQKKLNQIFERIYGDIFDRTPNILNIKSNTTERVEIERNTQGISRANVGLVSHVKLWMEAQAWQDFIFAISFFSLFALGMFLIGLGKITVGQFVVLLSYINLASDAFDKLGGNYKRLQEGIVTINRASRIFQEVPEKYADPDASEMKKAHGDVEFKNVSFAYHKEFVLKNINFKVSAGQMVAIVGKSGEGKTTLLNLLSRYLVPQKGRISIDNSNIQKIKLTDLRNLIAIVPQEIQLFNDTITDNIGYSKIGASEEEIIRASQLAHCHEFIEKFPRGYKQMVGERGVKLSTGQKQRVAIARAILRDPRILILDEATSALDSESERLVQAALEEVMKNRTTFVIAHRLSTIRKADLILVIENGEIVESGDHQELIEKGGVYQKLSKLQNISV